LVLLDLGLPTMPGLDVLRHIRQLSETARLPVIIFTGEAAEADRIVGLELGADDYIIKPFSPRELVARVRTVLRRTNGSPTAGQPPIKRGELVIDAAQHIVTYAGQLIVLTATEFRILHYLAGRAGEFATREQISVAARDGEGDAFDRTIDVHIKTIRRKLGPGGAVIETIRGFGYKVI
jgi:DNA-binding response OmpR family regulator